TRQVFLELRWYMRREVEQMIQIDETLPKDIKAFMESMGRPESSLPQANDMSMLLAASRVRGSRIVTSDLKLLNTIQDLKIDIDGIVGSAFVLELMESVGDEDIKKKLTTIRERIYAEEVRYSIERREAYDPVTRIRIIEDHAMRVLRSVKKPADMLDKKLARGQPLFVLDFIEDIKAGTPAMFEDFMNGKYGSLALEIEAVQNEIERLLIVSTLTEDKETHQALVDHAADLVLFLYYLNMICHLYRGTRDGVEKAISIGEEAFRLLMFAGIKNDELKASVFFVRILLALVKEDYETIDYFYSLYDSMISRTGLEQMMETSEGLYVTMQILRKFMGGFSLTKTKLQHPSVTASMLNDIARYNLLFDSYENAWQLASNAYRIGVAYGKEECAVQSFLTLYKISAATGDRFNTMLEKFAENALKYFVKNGWSTSEITPILNELQGKPVLPEDMSTGGPVPLERIPEQLRGWMDVLSTRVVDGTELLVVRNDRLRVRVGVVTTHNPELKSLKAGNRVALTNGTFEIRNATPEVIAQTMVMLIILPSEFSEISYEGGGGFSYLRLAKPISP
ncbi:MAG: hypothetical protein QXS20_10920, partial [Candidatus Thorarchaeota archaeon]